MGDNRTMDRRTFLASVAAASVVAKAAPATFTPLPLGNGAPRSSTLTVGQAALLAAREPEILFHGGRASGRTYGLLKWLEFGEGDHYDFYRGLLLVSDWHKVDYVAEEMLRLYAPSRVGFVPAGKQLVWVDAGARIDITTPEALLDCMRRGFLGSFNRIGIDDADQIEDEKMYREILYNGAGLGSVALTSCPTPGWIRRRFNMWTSIPMPVRGGPDRRAIRSGTFHDNPALDAEYKNLLKAHSRRES